jgi:ribosome-binding factor A
MLRRINLLNFSQVRNIVSSQQCLGQSKASIAFGKQVKMMKKIMVGREKGKRRYREEAHPKLIEASKLSSTEKQGKEANRRVTVLNKLFMKHITDMMACGDLADKIIGYGIQITTVRVSNDFRSLNVYWTSSGGQKSAEDISIDVVLRSIAGPLRHELSVLRVMGEVPQINFVRDGSHFRASEVDALLKRADFGEDFVPTDPTLFMKDQTKLELKLSDEFRAKIRELDTAEEEESEEIIEEYPEMRHNMFHVDHAKIMGAVLANMNKSAKAWEEYNNNETISDADRQLAIEKLMLNNKKLDEQKESREEFMDFLVRKQYEKKFKSEKQQAERYALNLEDDKEFEEFFDPFPDNDFLHDEAEDRK